MYMGGLYGIDLKNTGLIKGYLLDQARHIQVLMKLLDMCCGALMFPWQHPMPTCSAPSDQNVESCSGAGEIGIMLSIDKAHQLAGGGTILCPISSPFTMSEEPKTKVSKTSLQANEVLKTQIEASIGVARSLVNSWLPAPKPGEKLEDDDSDTETMNRYSTGRPDR